MLELDDGENMVIKTYLKLPSFEVLFNIMGKGYNAY